MLVAHRQVMGATLLASVVFVFSAANAAADGIPTPLPGVTSGPTTETIDTVVAAYGLACQSASSPGAPQETFCTRRDASGLILSVTYYQNPSLVLEAVASGTQPLPTEADTFLR